MKLVLDNIIFTLQRSGGISVVWYELLSRLTSVSNLDLSCIEYHGSEGNMFRSKLNFDLNKLLFYNTNVFCRFFNPFIGIKEKFIFHSSYYRFSTNKFAINITTVHDFTYELFCKGIKAKIHTWQKFRAIRKSDFIICISESTRKDLLSFVPGVDERKICVIYNGVSDDYYPIQLTDQQYSLPFLSNEYVIFVGARNGYKKFDMALNAVAASKYNFVIVGAALSSREIKKLNQKFIGSNKYICVGRIDNSALNILYNNAFCLLYPSAYEGFGIPVLEAQKAGCPVIAYNASSIPEIIGVTPLLINNLSVEEIHTCFHILEDEDVRLQIVNDGFCNVKRFSWNRMFYQVWQVYQDAWLLKQV